MPIQVTPAGIGASGKANWEMTGPGKIGIGGAVPKEAKGKIPTDPSKDTKAQAKAKLSKDVAIVLLWIVLLVICVMAVSYLEKLI